ncbi:MAG: cobalamin-dependent protein, partial [Brevundimonas sp.]|nr:cobalamin-dependent protein [Brevundimonas sp.]
MRISLATSLHLDHGAMPPDPDPGQTLPMQSFVPVGLLSLKAYADRALGPKVDIRVEELNTLIAAGGIPNDRDFHDHLASVILGSGADMVGLMTDADSLHHTVLVAERVRARSPRTLICVGGPTTSPMPARFLERFPQFDLLVRGEGEATFAHLLETLDE